MDPKSREYSDSAGEVIEKTLARLKDQFPDAVLDSLRTLSPRGCSSSQML